MPQLDQFTYLTQFVWLCVCFMSFYVLLYNDALPKISRILKLRSHLVSQQSEATDANNQLVEQDGVITQSLNSSVAYLYSSVSGASQWCNDMVTSFNANQIQPMNKAYVRSLAEMSVSQIVKSSALSTLSALASGVSSSKLNSIYVLRTQKITLINVNVKSGPRKKKHHNA
uniref:H(+)-transporting two-sector ATPase n=1 Tax=Zygnema circumcarinatum TaxID=35869 RepID=A0A6N0GXK4_ZYGCR|nr:ATP-synthase protein 8 [Zygnema circumcarinatum]QKQ14686.1 ATP-synthase protein 8 [Zygnema circumcarinatum]WEL36331.1 ATP-synthase protein 8 [Zygnema circumcarinatum]